MMERIQLISPGSTPIKIYTKTRIIGMTNRESNNHRQGVRMKIEYIDFSSVGCVILAFFIS